ncbi:MAG: hypothetical protein Q9160_000343 [Pyrenula sp. 1 TL-2023]
MSNEQSRTGQGQYPLPNDPNRPLQYPPAGQYPQQPDQGRQGQYPPPEPNRQASYSGQYPPDGQGQYPTPPYAPHPQHTQWSGSPGPGFAPPGAYPVSGSDEDPSQTSNYAYPPPHDPHAPLQPQHPDPYRLPPPPAMHQHHYYGPDPYRQAPPAQPQTAPRQRTAIACKYCRKRKAQTFVPAHVAYPHMNTNGQPPGSGAANAPPQLYGAHGQPLPPDYVQQDPRKSQGYAGYQPQGYPQTPGGQVDDRHGGPNRHLELSDQRQHASDRRESGPGSTGGYDYGDPTNLAPVSPAGSAPYQGQAPPQGGFYPSAPVSGPYPPRRGSPQSSVYSSEPPRTSNSPHGSASSASGVPPANYHRNNGPLRSDGRTPPPGQTQSGPGSAGRSGMSVRDMLGGPPGHDSGILRPQTDNDMVNALNRGSRRDDRGPERR